MKVTLEKAKPGVGLVKMYGRLDGSNKTEFEKSFITFLKEYNKFVFDCTELEFVDSSGLGTFIKSLEKASKQGGDIYIANLQAKPRLLFEITKAHKLFEVYDDPQSAIESI